jgi:hypothetical protein
MPCYQREVVAVMADVLSVEPSNRVIPASIGAGTHRQQDSTGKHSNRQKTRTADCISERQQAIKPPSMREVVNVACK